MSRIPVIGLTLSSGVARGLVHIGVLKALEEESIPIDLISGTSAGALIGALYASERKVSILEELALGIDWRKMARLADPNPILLRKGLIQGQKITSFLAPLIGDVEFKDLPIPLSVVAADVQSMEQVVINEGPVLEAVRASISLPAIFTPVKWKNRFLIDGGVLNPMPADIARNMGAEIVIAVNALNFKGQEEETKPSRRENQPPPIPHPEAAHLATIRRKIVSLVQENKDASRIIDRISEIATSKIHAASGKLDPQTPSMFHTLLQSIHAMEYEIVRLSATSADIVISPDVSHIGTFEFFRGEEAIEQGYKATMVALPQIKQLIHLRSSSQQH